MNYPTPGSFWTELEAGSIRVGSGLSFRGRGKVCDAWCITHNNTPELDGGRQEAGTQVWSSSKLLI